MSNAKAEYQQPAANGLVDLEKRPVAEVLATLGVKPNVGLSNA